MMLRRTAITSLGPLLLASWRPILVLSCPSLPLNTKTSWSCPLVLRILLLLSTRLLLLPPAVPVLIIPSLAWLTSRRLQPLLLLPRDNRQ